MKKNMFVISESTMRKVISESVNHVLCEKLDVDAFDKEEWLREREDGTMEGSSGNVYQSGDVQEHYGTLKKERDERWDLERSLAKKLISSSRLYRPCNSDYSVVEKVFNGGAGRLQFVQFIVDERVILVNNTVARKGDIERIETLFPDWDIEYVTLGYPDWYSKSLKSMRGK